VDWRGEFYPISRWTSVKAKEVRARLGLPDDLPSVTAIKQVFAKEQNAKINDFRSDVDSARQKDIEGFERQRAALVTEHRNARAVLKEQQSKRQIIETRARAARLPTGIKALWLRVTGRYRKILDENEAAYEHEKSRDQRERQRLIDQQLKQRRVLQHEKLEMHHRHDVMVATMERDIKEWRAAVQPEQESSTRSEDDSTPRRRRRGVRDRSP
jgi:hypothetical protein